MVSVIFHLFPAERVSEAEDVRFKDNHPVLQSPFVQTLLSDLEICKTIPVVLPKFFQRENFVLFLNVLHDNAAGDKTMGFGKHFDITYRNVTEWIKIISGGPRR